jgi:hypothetical protein
MDFRFVKIKVETVLGENESMDKMFFEYLDEYSITHKMDEAKGDNGCPIVEYEGGPISLYNMLKEKFGMEREDIEQSYPQLNE